MSAPSSLCTSIPNTFVGTGPVPDHRRGPASASPPQSAPTHQSMLSSAMEQIERPSLSSPAILTPLEAPPFATPSILPSPPDRDLLSPSIPAPSRPRSSTVSSSADGYDSSSSSDDSVLSWWSSDEDESDAEVDEEKEAERKRREEERQKILATAGLKLRREPPGVPARQERKVSRRRPAPAAPKDKSKAKARRHAPPIPLSVTDKSEDERERIVTPEAEAEEVLSPTTTTPTLAEPPNPEVQLQDAYARYEQFLAQSKSRATRPGRSRAGSSAQIPFQVISPQLTGVSPTSPSFAGTSTSASASLAGSLGGMGVREGKLSGFFSRMMAPTLSHEGVAKDAKARPSISGPIGPITRVDPVDRGDSESPGMGEESEFGKTWSSLVEPSVLETMSSRERKRQEAIFEFIATEGTYNRDLQLVVNVFYASLLGLPSLEEKALTVIFANIEDILLSATAFLSSLEARQRSCRLYVDVIGDVLDEFAGSMEVYRTYCVNEAQAGRLLQALRGQLPELAAHLQTIRETNPECRGLDLSSFLLVPMQRITRYPLLLKQIAHYTEPDQDLGQVQHAQKTVEGIVAGINEAIRLAEGEERLRVLSEDLWIGGEGRLDLTAPTAYQGPRKLLKEGPVTKSKSGRKLTLVLCNDVLVLIESRNLYRMPIPLFELAVRESRDSHGFVLKLDYHRGGDAIALKAPSAKEAKDWVAMIEKARLRTIDARKNVNRRSRADSLRSDF